MAGAVLHLGAVVLGTHGAPAEPIIPTPNLLVADMPAIAMESPWLVAGCPLEAIVPVPPPFCVMAEFVVGSVRVLADGVPLTTQLGVSIAEASGTPLIPLVVQELVMVE